MLLYVISYNASVYSCSLFCELAMLVYRRPEMNMKISRFSPPFSTGFLQTISVNPIFAVLCSRWEWFHPIIWRNVFLLMLPTFDSSPSLTQKIPPSFDQNLWLSGDRPTLDSWGRPRAFRVWWNLFRRLKRNFLPLEMDTPCIVFWVRSLFVIFGYPPKWLQSVI